MYSSVLTKEIYCKALICLILLGPIQGTTVQHSSIRREGDGNKNYALSPPSSTKLSASVAYDQPQMNLIHNSIGTTNSNDYDNYNGYAPLPYEDDSAARIDELAGGRELDIALDTLLESKPGKKKLVKKTKQTDNTKDNDNDDSDFAITEAPTTAEIPVSDLSIPPKLDECLLEALPQREVQRKRIRKFVKAGGNGGRKLRAATRNTESSETMAWNLQELHQESSLEQQQQRQQQGFDYTASTAMDWFIKSYNGMENENVNYYLNDEDEDEDDDDDDDDNYDDDTNPYNNEIHYYLYNDYGSFEDDSLLSSVRRLQDDSYDLRAIDLCLQPYQNAQSVFEICRPPTSPPTTGTESDPPTSAPTCAQDDIPICKDDIVCVGDEIIIPCDQIASDDITCSNCPCQCVPEPTFAPTCDQDDIPICEDDIVCVGNEIIIPCDQIASDDITCSNCPCQCYGGKGKGKGKGKGSYYEGKGKGSDYEGKGKGSYYQGKGKGSYYQGKGKGKGSYYHGKGKGSKGSKGGAIGGNTYLSSGAIADLFDARVVKIVRNGICVPTSSPTNFPSFIPSNEPTTNPTTEPSKRPTTEPSKRPTTEPSKIPTPEPTVDSRTPVPSIAPVVTRRPGGPPTVKPTEPRTLAPGEPPTEKPTEPRTLAPTCDQDDIPICEDDIVCVGNEIIIPCDQIASDDITCSNCPCQCYGGKGKGKGKGCDYEGKGKGSDYEGKGKGSDYEGKGKGSYYQGKGGGKGSKGSKARVKIIKASKIVGVLGDGSDFPSFSPQSGDDLKLQLEPNEQAQRKRRRKKTPRQHHTSGAKIKPNENGDEESAAPAQIRRKKTEDEGDIEATILLRYLQQSYDDEDEELPETRGNDISYVRLS